MGLDSRWTATIDAAIKDPRSTAYDATILAELSGYNARFAKTPGFVALTPSLFKAIILTESGGPASPEWSTRPMQIGKFGDPGYSVLRLHPQHADIIMDQRLQTDIATKPIREPILNIRAGIAFVLVMAANYTRVSQVDSSDADPRVHTVVKDDSFARITTTERTTVPELQSSNPAISATLHPGQKLNFHRARMVALISGWSTIDAQFVAKRYNGGGDPAYAEKITYCMAKLP